MAQTTPPTITAAPTAPQRSDKSTFSARVDAFVSWLIAAVSQFGAVATNVYNNAVDAYNSAVAAAASVIAAAGHVTTAQGHANAASASATAAAAGANAPAWVSGTTYTVGQVVYSPLNFRSYRRKTAGAGTTDPSQDTTNWEIPFGPFALLHVRDEKASGTAGGTQVAADFTQVRTLNTVKTNTITGASLASNQITLPAGTYQVRGSAPCNRGIRHKIALRNVSDSAFTLVGANMAVSGGDNRSEVWGQFTISASKVFSLVHFTDSAPNGVSDLGQASNTGQVEVYSELWIEKVG